MTALPSKSVQFASIGLVNILHTGGGVKSLVYGEEGNSVQIGEKGTGEMRVFASEKPLGCRIDGSTLLLSMKRTW